MVIVTVTKDDIKNGKPRTIDACPVALALKRLFPNEEITVFAGSIRIGNKIYKPVDSYKIKTFLYLFDNNQPVTEGDFTYVEG